MALRGLAGNDGKMIPPSISGKLKASFQFWSIGFVMLDFNVSLVSFTLDEVVVFLALIFSYISGYQYFREYYKTQ